MSSHLKDHDESFSRRGGSTGMVEAFETGGDNGGEILAEQPSMRAVAIMSGPSLVTGPPPIGLSKLPPPLGISRHSGLPSRPQPNSDYFGVNKQEIFGVVQACAAWEVKSENLDAVPDFPLERTHRVVPDVGAPEVARRISEALRQHSIDAEYDGKAAKAKCKTSDYVCFRIRLYAGGDNCEPVVVEIQRRCGSASSFMRTCRAILNAAEGKSAPESSPFLGTQTMPPSFKSVGQMSFMRSVPPPLRAMDVDAEASFALDNAMDMIRSPKRDSNVLGLENLSALTDPIKTNPSVALKISKRLILVEDNYDIREEIRLLTEHDVFESDAEARMTKHADQLRNLALSVLSNALEVCSKEGSLGNALGEKWFQENLFPTLVDEVNRSETNACNASVAACCIHSLMTASPATVAMVQQSIADSGGLEALLQANDFGRRRHEFLAKETSRCLNLMNASLPSNAL